MHPIPSKNGYLQNIPKILRYNLRFFIFLFVFMSTIFCQQALADISGKVTYMGVPVRNARVVLEVRNGLVIYTWSYARETTTDENGNYYLSCMDSKTYRVYASSEYYYFDINSGNPYSFSNSNNGNAINITVTGRPTYTVSGRVSNTTGNNWTNGISVALTGQTVSNNPQNTRRITGQDGSYSFTVEAVDPYNPTNAVTIVPTSTQWGYTYSSQILNDIGYNVTNLNFYVTPISSVTVSGSLIKATPNTTHPVISNVDVRITGPGIDLTTQTDASGNYSFNVPPFQTYTMTFSGQGLEYTRTSTYNDPFTINQNVNSAANAIFPSVTARAKMINLTINILDNLGVLLPGTSLIIDGTSSTYPDGVAYPTTSPAVLTDANGQYVFSVPARGTYKVIPSKTSYSFGPDSKTFTYPATLANQTQYFVGSTALGQTHTISGYVRLSGGAGVNGINVQITGAVNGYCITTTKSGNPGYYEFIVVDGQSYVINIPTGQGYDFSSPVPPVNINNVTADVTQNFTATLHQYYISGNVTSSDGYVIRNVTIGGGITATTNASGNYTSGLVNALGNYSIIPSKTGYTFNPVNINLTSLKDATNGHTFSGNNFIGTLASPTLSLPNNSVQNQSLRPTLVWNASAGAGKYILEYSTDPTFSSAVQKIVIAAGTTSYQIPVGSELLNSTDYYWHVRAQDPNAVDDNSGPFSAWSGLRYFTTVVAAPSAPVLVYPGVDETKVSTTPAFSWNAADRATEYRIQVRVGSATGNTVINTAVFGGATTFTSAVLDPSTIYYWRVGAWNAGCTDTVWSSSWASTRKFTTTITTPQPQAGIGSPATIINGATNQPLTGVPLGWNNGGSSVNPDFYHLQINDKSDFTGTMIVNNTSLAFDLANNPYRYVYSGSSLTNGKTYYWRVAAIKGSDKSGWSDVWSFTTIVQVPGVPVLVSPDNNSIRISTLPTLSWQAPSTGGVPSSYRLRVWRTGTTDTVLTYNSTDITTAYEFASLLLPQTQYSWRVKAVNAGGESAWTGIWNFTTSIPVPVPTATNGTANGVTILNLTNIPLNWVPGEPSTPAPNSYDVEVSTSPTFETGKTVFTNNPVSGPINITAILNYGTTYYWHVRAVKTSPADQSAWSEVWSFKTIVQAPGVPVLVSPENNKLRVSTLPTLSWQAPTAGGVPSSYRLRVWRTGTTDTVLTYNSSDITTAYTFASLLLPQTQYSWMVKAINAGGESAWTGIWSFTTSIPVPVPTATNGTTNSSTVLTLTNIPLNWVPGEPSTPAPNGYDLEVSTSPSFETGTIVYTANNIVSGPHSINPSPVLEYGKTYYWHVKAKKTSPADESAWSIVWNFTTIIQKPEPPVLQTPEANALKINTTPVFVWNSALRASEYRLQIREGATIIVDQPITSSATSYSLTTPLKPTTVYTYRVGSWNAGCLVAADTAWDVEGWRQFTTSIPIPVPTSVNGTPNGNPVSILTNIPINWEPGTPSTPVPDGYVVEVSTSSTFDAGTVVYTGNSVSGPHLINPVNPLDYNTTYYWRVKAIRNAPADESGWSVVWSFITGLAKPTLSKPDNHATVETKPTLTWNLVAGASRYRLQWSENSSFNLYQQEDLAAGAYTFSVPFDNNKTIFWRVQAYNIVSGITYNSEWSDTWDFTTTLAIPNLKSPLNLATLNVVNPLLEWEIVPGAVSYEIVYSTSPNFTGEVFTQTNTGNGNITWQLPALLTNTAYYWHARAVNSSGVQSNWSSTWTFTTGLAAPVIISPVNNLTVSTTPVFNWNTSVGATDYYLEIYNNSSFTGSPVRVYPGASDPALTGTTWTVPESNPLPIGQYYWRVRAHNSGGNSQFSNHANPSFTTSSLVPILVYPTNGAVGVPCNLEFQWNGVASATGYTLQISTESNFRDRPMVFEGNVDALKKIINGMSKKTLHFWRVGAIINGSPVWSATWSFRTAGALISVDNNALRFDSTVVGKTNSKSITIINNGADLLLIPKISISGTDAGNFSCSEISSSSISIPAGERKTITVNFTPIVTGVLNAKLEIYHNDATAENNPVIVSLTGTGVNTMARLSLKSPFDFGQKFILTEPKDSFIVVTNTSGVQGDMLTLSSAYFETQNGVFEVLDKLPISIQPGMSYNLRLRFNPIINGIMSNTLHIKNSSLNTDAICQVFGTIKEGNLVIKPTSIDFKNTTIARPYKDSIIEIINYGLNPITIARKTINGDSSSFSFVKNTNNVTLITGKTDTVIIRFYPHDIAGRKIATLNILTDDPLGLKRSVNLSGIAGDNPVISVDPYSIDFDVIAKTVSKDTTVTIKNIGSLDLNITGLRITGTNADIFSIVSGYCPVTIKAGENAKFKLRATGQLPIGAKNAALEITSNDPDQPVKKIDLSVIVKTPSYWKSLDKIIWDTVLVKYCVDSSFTIGNSGNMSLIVKSLSLEGPNAADFTISGLVTPFELRPDSIKSIKVMYCPKSEGNRYASLLIKTDDPSALESRVVLRGNTLLIYPELASDTLIDFGKIAILDSSKRNITLTNKSSLIKLTIDSIKLINTDGNYFSHSSKTTPFVLEKASNYTFALKFYPVSADNKYPSGDLLVYYDNPAKSPLKVRLTGTVSMPRVSNNLTQVLEFGKVPIDSTKTVSFFEMNTGDADLKIESATITGSDSSEFKVITRFPVTIPQESKQVFYVSFSPKKIGQKEATIKFVWNDLFNSGIIKFWAEAIAKGAGTLGIKNNEIPKEFGLSQNYPNPFNPNTKIEYALPKECYVKIKIYNSLGQEVSTLVDGLQHPGNYILDWNPHYLASGVYYYRIQAGSYTSMKKMMYIR
jgi:hypothetical protein